MSLSKHQQVVYSLIKQRPIAYSGALAICFKSRDAAIMFNQLLYWQDKTSRKDGYFYKTADEMFIETGLSRNNQRTALNILINYGVVSHKLASIPAKHHYRVEISKLTLIITSLMKSNHLALREVDIKIEEHRKSITKNTKKPYQSKLGLIQRHQKRQVSEAELLFGNDVQN